MCTQKVDESLVLVPVSDVQCSAFPNLHTPTQKIFNDIPTSLVEYERLLHKSFLHKVKRSIQRTGYKKFLVHRRLWRILCYQT